MSTDRPGRAGGLSGTRGGAPAVTVDRDPPPRRRGRGLQLAMIAACLAAAVILIVRWVRPEVPNGHIPADFPNAWLAPEDDGHPERVVVIPGRNEPPAPVERDGRKLFQAFQCLNERCPGRVDGKPYVFAHWEPRPCPRCGCADRNLVVRWFTPEGAAMVERIRSRFAP